MHSPDLNPFGLPLSHAPGVPLFCRPYILSWWQRRRWTEVKQPPWWKLWGKPETLQCSQWERKIRAISQDLADYLLDSKYPRRTEQLILSMSDVQVTDLFCIQLELPAHGGSTTTTTIKTGDDR